MLSNARCCERLRGNVESAPRRPLRNSRALADDTDVTLLSKLRRVLVVLVALLGAGLIATVVLRDERSILPKDLASARRAFSSTPLPPGFRRVACADTSFGCYRGGAV